MLTACPFPLQGGAADGGGGAALMTPRGMLARTALAASTTFAAASLTYPLDIVRKRLIIDSGSDAPRYGGRFTTAVSRIYAAEGLGGFFRAYGFDMVFRWGWLALSRVLDSSESVVCGSPAQHLLTSRC